MKIAYSNVCNISLMTGLYVKCMHISLCKMDVYVIQNCIEFASKYASKGGHGCSCSTKFNWHINFLRNIYLQPFYKYAKRSI